MKHIGLNHHGRVLADVYTSVAMPVKLQTTLLFPRMVLQSSHMLPLFLPRRLHIYCWSLSQWCHVGGFIKNHQNDHRTSTLPYTPTGELSVITLPQLCPVNTWAAQRQNIRDLRLPLNESLFHFDSSSFPPSLPFCYDSPSPFLLPRPPSFSVSLFLPFPISLPSLLSLPSSLSHFSFCVYFILSFCVLRITQDFVLPTWKDTSVKDMYVCALWQCITHVHYSHACTHVHHGSTCTYVYHGSASTHVHYGCACTHVHYGSACTHVHRGSACTYVHHGSTSTHVHYGRACTHVYHDGISTYVHHGSACTHVHITLADLLRKNLSLNLECALFWQD